MRDFKVVKFLALQIKVVYSVPYLVSLYEKTHLEPSLSYYPAVNRS